MLSKQAAFGLFSGLRQSILTYRDKMLSFGDLVKHTREVCGCKLRSERTHLKSSIVGFVVISTIYIVHSEMSVSVCE